MFRSPGPSDKHREVVGFCHARGFECLFPSEGGGTDDDPVEQVAVPKATVPAAHTSASEGAAAPTGRDEAGDSFGTARQAETGVATVTVELTGVDPTQLPGGVVLSLEALEVLQMPDFFNTALARENGGARRRSARGQSRPADGVSRALWGSVGDARQVGFTHRPAARPGSRTLHQVARERGARVGRRGQHPASGSRAACCRFARPKTRARRSTGSSSSAKKPWAPRAQRRRARHR